MQNGSAEVYDRTDASRRPYRSGVCTHPRATPAQSAACHTDGAVQRSARKRLLAGGSSAAPLGGFLAAMKGKRKMNRQKPSQQVTKTKGKVGSKEKNINKYGKNALYGLVFFSLIVGLGGGVSDAESIGNCAELQYDMKEDLSGDYYLARDIDCSATATWNEGEGFEPVGDDSNKFTGTFDGRGYTITGLCIYRPDTTYVGLFGYTGLGSEIKNVGLEDVSVSGYWRVGGLVGWNDGIISTSYSRGSVSCDFYQVGGLVGSNDGLITDSYSAVSVASGFSSVGGLVGSNSGTIRNSYSTGSVSGDDSVGGLVGANINAFVQSSFWDTETSGQSTSDGGAGKTTAEMKTKSTFGMVQKPRELD
jgi:hypothetical protein